MTVVMVDSGAPGSSEARNYTTGPQPSDIVMFDVSRRA